MGGPNLDDISVFNRYIGNEYLFNKAIEETGAAPDDGRDRVYWFIDRLGMDNFNQTAFDE